MAKKASLRKLDIGLDLTSNELRCVAVSRKGKETMLEAFAIGEISSSYFAAGRVAEPGALGARIREILAENGISPRKGIVSLSGKAAITRIIELPKMGPAQTRQAISLQINQYVPFPPGDTVYDYKQLPAREGANPAMQEVLLVATRATTVDSLIQTARAAGIECDGIKITTLAAWNVFSQQMQGYTQGVGIIDIRDTVTDLSFFLNGQFRLSRPVEVGYNSILAKIGQLLGVSAAEAESYLRTEPVDITIPEEEIDPTEDNRLREALLSVFSNFISELIRSIRYYESQAQRSERVGKMLLFGNISLFPNLPKYLEDQTGLEIVPVSLSQLLLYRQGVYSLEVLERHASKLPVAAGLALEMTKKKKELNLMPPSYYTRHLNQQILTFGVLLLAILGGFGWMQSDKQSKAIAEQKRQLDDVTQRANSLKPAADEFDSIKAEVQNQLPRFKQIYALFRDQRMWPPIMEELGNRTNDQVWLTEVDFEAGTNTIKMKGIGVERVDIVQFAINVDKSPFFTNSHLTEKAEDQSGGSGGGGGGGGGGGPAGGFNATSSSGPPEQAGSKVTLRAGPAQGSVPRFDFQPGLSIEDFFRGEYRQNIVLVWKFEMSTDLQNEIKNQTVSTLEQLEGVINSVVQT
jgi:type IV pilus assembly protein PilM